MSCLGWRVVHRSPEWQHPFNVELCVTLLPEREMIGFYQSTELDIARRTFQPPHTVTL
jgi:hypothetical protein